MVSWSDTPSLPGLNFTFSKMTFSILSIFFIKKFYYAVSSVCFCALLKQHAQKLKSEGQTIDTFFKGCSFSEIKKYQNPNLTLPGIIILCFVLINFVLET